MRKICVLFLFSLLLCGEISCKSVTQTIPAERSHSKKTKRQLFKFTPMQAPWLNEYPVIQKEVEGIIKKEKESITKDAEELFQEFPTTALLPYELEVKELKLFKHDKQARHILFEKRKQKDKTAEDPDLKTWIEEGTSQQEDFKIWNFKQDGIVLTFPEYQVGPFSAGSFEVFVSLKSL